MYYLQGCEGLNQEIPWAAPSNITGVPHDSSREGQLLALRKIALVTCPNQVHACRHGSLT